jgi:hypothetical protein
MSFDFHPESAQLMAIDLASCELGGEAVLLNTDSGTYYGLNSVGTAIWRLLQQPRSIAELCELVAAEFAVTPERCKPDVIQFVGMLYEQRLLLVRQVADA